jgi:hypothetical protein
VTREAALSTAADLELGAAAFERYAEELEKIAGRARRASELWQILAQAQLARLRADEILVVAQRLRNAAAGAAA